MTLSEAPARPLRINAALPIAAVALPMIRPVRRPSDAAAEKASRAAVAAAGRVMGDTELRTPRWRSSAHVKSEKPRPRTKPIKDVCTTFAITDIAFDGDACVTQRKTLNASSHLGLRRAKPRISTFAASPPERGFRRHHHDRRTRQRRPIYPACARTGVQPHNSPIFLIKIMSKTINISPPRLRSDSGASIRVDSTSSLQSLAGAARRSELASRDAPYGLVSTPSDASLASMRSSTAPSPASSYSVADLATLSRHVFRGKLATTRISSAQGARHAAVSMCTEQGERPHQEDRGVIVSGLSDAHGSSFPMTFLGVWDGTVGDYTADRASVVFVDNVVDTQVRGPVHCQDLARL